jgi:hypothetical protein
MGAIKDRLQLSELFERGIAPGEGVALDACERNDQVIEESGVLSRNRALMAEERALMACSTGMDRSRAER